MPSPKRNNDSSSVAYTRWEAVEADDTASLRLPFEEFQEEEDVNSDGSPQRQQQGIVARLKGAGRNNNNVESPAPNQSFALPKNDVASMAVRALCVLIIFGLGWIFGFLVRWGIHTHYIDPLGHCTVPKSYSYNPSTANVLMKKIHHTNIQSFFNNFTMDEHLLGSDDSLAYALRVEQQWRDFGLLNVHKDCTKVLLPTVSERTSTITVRDHMGNVQWSKNLTQEDNGKIAFVQSGAGTGQLVYGHYGRFEDFSSIDGYDLNGSIIMLRVSSSNDIGSMIRNAEWFGATAVILFPDAIFLNKTNIDDQTPVNAHANFFPGDPLGPYVSTGPNSSLPSVPVISINHADAMLMVTNYVNAFRVSDDMADVLPVDQAATRNFNATVELFGDVREEKMYNVMGSIPGLYEPTRYVLVAAHHDTWVKGSSRAGMAHAVLMEMVRVFGQLFKEGWRPGRSILFASWDGEELGQLGSTSWMHSHAKELASRAVAVINLESEAMSGEQPNFSASPLLRRVIDRAAQSIPCSQTEQRQRRHVHSEGGQDEEPELGSSCTLFDEWVKKPFHHLRSTSSASAFQNVMGISTMDVSVGGDGEDASKEDSYGDEDNAVVRIKKLMDAKCRYSARMARFASIAVMQLLMNPDLPVVASDYEERIRDDIVTFKASYDQVLDEHHVDRTSLETALDKLGLATSRFHNEYNANPFMEFLAHHEFSDQLMELERAMLLPSAQAVGAARGSLLNTPARHVVYGPWPLDRSRVVLFPQLTAAIEVAIAAKDINVVESWRLVNMELFFVVDALDSAACVLDNHLVHTYPEEKLEKEYQ